MPSTRRMTKNGAPRTPTSTHRASGSGTVTPAAWATRRRAYSLARERLTASEDGASVRKTSPWGTPPTTASSAQFC